MTSDTIARRVAPPVPGMRAGRLIERNLLVYRRIWPVILSGLFEPIFYLFSIGIGIGELVGDITAASGQVVSYTQYVAPALLASSAMNGAIYESTFNIFFKLKYERTYDAILATPIQPLDIAVGEIGWSLMRGAFYAVVFLVMMAAMGLIESAYGILALPAALLIGFAFGAAGMAATSFMRSWQDFDLVTLVTLPLFLFSATFYPLSVYPPALQVLTHLSPLYHGVALIRELTLGTPGPAALGHAAFLLAVGLIGLRIASRRIARLLLK